VWSFIVTNECGDGIKCNNAGREARILLAGSR
jgi:hypothetical protein